MPAQRRSVATAGFILDAAVRILEEQGLDGYTTNAIAERVRSLTLTEGNLTLDDAFWSQKIVRQRLEDVQTEIRGFRADVAAWVAARHLECRQVPVPVASPFWRPYHWFWAGALRKGHKSLNVEWPCSDKV